MLKIIRHPSGTLRIAIICAAEWLMASIYPLQEKDIDFEIGKKNSAFLLSSSLWQVENF